MKGHANIPVFIPHLGCPNMCVFCNQRTISGVDAFDVSSVKREIEGALLTIPEGCETEIAFFGGSFTGIDRSLMTELLEIAYTYIKKGRVSSVRCSTRPDYIDEEVLEILRRYGVGTIELGLQSSSERVLKTTKRGHGFTEEERAVRLITKAGFTLVGQMMIGLPESTLEDEIKTADFIIKSGASAARIYPTVVFRSTELCAMAERGEYTPISTEEAVLRSLAVYEKFYDAGVEVIRIGLQSTEGVRDEAELYGGASHSAIGELVLNEFYYKRIKNALLSENLPKDAQVFIKVPKGAVSKAVGQRKTNKLRLIEEFSLKKLSFREDETLSSGEVAVSLEERENKCI